MSVKIVSFDLKKPWQYYKDLIKAIEAYDCAKMTNSFWYINTQENCEDVFRNLEIYVEIDDRLLVQDLNEREMTGQNLLSTEERLQSLFK